MLQAISFLRSHLVPAKTPEGAAGGELLPVVY
jgi:hypothetical protein